MSLSRLDEDFVHQTTSFDIMKKKKRVKSHEANVMMNESPSVVHHVKFDDVMIDMS